MRRILLGLLLLLALWLVVRNAAVTTLASNAPHVALRFPPASGEALVAKAVAENRLLPKPQLRELLHKSLVRAPLSGKPFFLAAAHANQAGNLKRATELMETAVQRDSRRTVSRLALLSFYLLQERWNDAVDEAFIIGRRHSHAAPQIVALLLDQMEKPEARQFLLAKVRVDRAWRKDFISYARGTGGHDELLAALEARPE